ncbi:uncharacterized protein L969DRAFT_15565 [Mixia osmundae IAM 14324]|uniref:Uncharacterized protein n=1 Tax=Mixia osmundae (strain CBS 9802 / IAM 14324 / JCM 22182 / KY 12970) TaxID=764103 RepID=G7DYI2_MIXOS|nr:uncharacterized protein L969DRAFT_15565 [Mixia osmundae IAM 14324]KEI41543.1 hypothetical protein L969DRAFT_15565 [Mixia osmundae IAM 14324]GAA95642.1 hypothetical protein E5Q_02298 [Mixia osmundae IAM 14324]
MHGIYDVIAGPVRLPKKQVQAALPDDVTLLPLPSSFGLGDDEHIVLLLLGRQQKVGIMLTSVLGLHMQECKIEVPYCCHPSLKGMRSGGSSDRDMASMPYTYKHTVIFDSTMLAKSGNVTPGLHCLSTSFTPPRAPTESVAVDDHLQYDAMNVLVADLKLADAPSTSSPRVTCEETVKMMQGPWWHQKMGAKASRFEFDLENPLLPVKRYQGSIKINAALLTPAVSSNVLSSKPTWLELDEVMAFRFKANWASFGPDLAKNMLM